MSPPRPWRVARGEPGYPECVAELRDRAPAALYGLGPLRALAEHDPSGAVTIVGSRRTGAYGRGVARELGFGAASAGLAVVSGMALGCDSAAHEGALDARGFTVAVLASGPDVPSPRSRSALWRRILAGGGLVLSEHPPGVEAQAHLFPQRNRIMAALAGLSVVVEGTLRSGTRHTVEDAQRLGRDVAAVPGPVTSTLSDLPNELIRDGAGVIRDAQDLLDATLGVGVGSARREGPELGQPERAALAAVEAGATGSDAVATAAGLDARDAAGALARLELAGYLRADALGRYARTGLRPPEPGAAAG